MRDENQLINKLLMKDRKAIEYLYDNYSGILYGICLRVLKNKEIAEEVFEEAFLKIIFNISTYDKKKSTLSGWLIKTVRHYAINYSESKIDKQKNLPFERNENNINLEDFAFKLSLNNIELQILDLLYFQDYPQSQISELLNIPLNIVKEKLRSSIQALKNHPVNNNKELDVNFPHALNNLKK